MMEDSWQVQEPNLNDKISFKTVENQNDCSDIDEELNEEKKQFSCTICNKTFRNRCDKNYHIERVHEGLKPYECELCNSRFGSKNYLRVHISSVHQKKSVVQCTGNPRLVRFLGPQQTALLGKPH